MYESISNGKDKHSTAQVRDKEEEEEERANTRSVPSPTRTVFVTFKLYSKTKSVQSQWQKIDKNQSASPQSC